MWHLLWEAFTSTCEDSSDLTEMANTLTVTLSENKIPAEDQLQMIKDKATQISSVLEKFNEFRETLTHQPNAIFWNTFLDMSDILIIFPWAQREGDWLGHLCESAKMLPYLTAAGHYKYEQESLPLYIHEMKTLEWTAQ